jgi:glutathione-specific gamma-glutamylcyclotransferase
MTAPRRSNAVTHVPNQQERCAADMLKQTQRAWGGNDDLWVFGYASLIWRPEFKADEQREARVHGWHRALKMQSRAHRGTPETPGLVFALMAGGCCRGMVYRIHKDRAAEELTRLWEREMPNSVYDPKWLPCQTLQGKVKALAFTLSRRSPQFVGHLPDHALLSILRTAKGGFGTSMDYLLETANSLRNCGIRDREIERMVALVRKEAAHTADATFPKA